MATFLDLSTATRSFRMIVVSLKPRKNQDQKKLTANCYKNIEPNETELEALAKNFLSHVTCTINIELR